MAEQFTFQTQTERDLPEGLKPECGVSQISLANFVFMREKFGNPKEIKLWFHGVEIDFEGDRSFLFTGFSWGYGGEGPSTFQRALYLSGAPNHVIRTIKQTTLKNRENGVFPVFLLRAREWEALPI